MNLKLYYQLSLVLSITVSTFFFPNCGHRTSEKSHEIVIAKVADRAITLDEFVKRAEYTIRPPYAKLDNYVQKKIILNSLIAEKLLALESGEKNELFKNKEFQSYIQGRKEQAMRRCLYREEGYAKVKLDPHRMKKSFYYSCRDYKIKYFSIGDSATVAEVKKNLKAGIPFEQVYNKVYGIGDVPERVIEWQKEENDEINYALFSDSLVAGQIVGPIKTEDNLWTVMKVVNWIYNPVITESENVQHKSDVMERLTRMDALRLYGTYASNIMKGKSVEFVGSTFFKFLDLIQPYYLVNSTEFKQSVDKQLWQNKDEPTVNSESNAFLDIKDQPILKVDGDVWTVEDLQKELMRHPFVFRANKLNNKNFPEQVKLATVDLLRDKYLTKEAYHRGYDKLPSVQAEVEMWQDSFNALYHREEYLKSVGDTLNFSKEYMQVIDQYLNPYVNSLQKKYSDKVFINMDEFEKIRLTHIDMFATERNVPFPLIVPSFPILTTYDRLDYGQVMKK
jgi:hypothetical protein